MKKNIFSSYKRFTFISMFMFLIVAKIFAQLEVISHIPTNIINVGINEEEFRLELLNSHDVELTNLAITINQPQGMVLNESRKSITESDNFNLRIEDNKLIFSSLIDINSADLDFLIDATLDNIVFGDITVLTDSVYEYIKDYRRPWYVWSHQGAIMGTRGARGDLFSIDFDGILPDTINIKFTYGTLDGGVIEDFTFYPYLMPCAPEISLEANDICLGDTLIVSLNLTGVHEDCEYSNYMFYTSFDGLEISNYSIDYSSETTQELTIDGTSVYSILNNGVFEQTGELIRFIFVPNNSGEYNIEINDFLIGNSSLINSSLTVNVFDKPVISPLSDVTLCEGENAEIAIAATLSQTAQWTRPNGDVESVDTITVSIAGQYVVSLTENNCTATDTIAVIVNEKPEISSLSDITLCEGNNAEIGIAATLSQTAQWTMPNGDVESVDTITVSIAGQYVVSLTENNCTATDTIAVIVNEKPEISSLSDVTLCEGENAEIGIAATQSQTAQWTMPNGDVESEDIITVSTEGEYVFSLIENNCEATVKLQVVINPNPQVTLKDASLIEGESVELTPVATGSGLSFEWSDGSNTETIMVTEIGAYSVTVTDNNQCIASASATVSSSVNLLDTKKTKVSLYPVPAENVLYVSANFTISAIEITTILGQSVIEEYQLSDNKVELSVSNLSPALYNIKVYGTNGEFESLEFTKK